MGSIGHRTLLTFQLFQFEWTNKLSVEWRCNIGEYQSVVKNNLTIRPGAPHRTAKQWGEVGKANTTTTIKATLIKLATAN